MELRNNVLKRKDMRDYTKLIDEEESKPRICSKKKPCCIHRLCNAQNDMLCCPQCEPKALDVEWSYEGGYSACH